jgi:hypothetical protein
VYNITEEANSTEVGEMTYVTAAPTTAPTTCTNDTTTAFGNGGFGVGYGGGALAPNGNIYMPPAGQSEGYVGSILKIDTTDDSTSFIETGLTEYSTEYRRHPGWSGCHAVGSMLYCTPWFDTALVLKIDTSTDTTSLFDAAGGKGFGPGVLHPNGIIYCFPLHSYNQANKVMKIDTSTDTTTILSVPGLGNHYSASALGENGYIYSIPIRNPLSYGSVNSVLKFNPADDSVAAHLELNCGTSGWNGWGWGFGVSSSQGSLYAAPRRSQKILKIATLPGTADEDAITCIDTVKPSAYTSADNNFIETGSDHDGNWDGSVVAPNGQMYFTPLHGGVIMKLDPADDTTSVVEVPAEQRARGLYQLSDGKNSGWMCNGVLAPSGDVYFAPTGDYAAGADLASNTDVLKLSVSVCSTVNGGPAISTDAGTSTEPTKTATAKAPTKAPTSYYHGPVTWTEPANVDASTDGYLEKPAGSQGGWNAGAISAQAIASSSDEPHGVSFRCTTQHTDGRRDDKALIMVGLDTVQPNTNLDYKDMPFAMYCRDHQGGTLMVFKSGVQQGGLNYAGGYTATDVLKVQAVGSNIEFLKNDVVFYTTQRGDIPFPLHVDAILNQAGDTLADVIMY